VGAIVDSSDPEVIDMREKKSIISSLKFWETPDPYPDSIATTTSSGHTVVDANELFEKVDVKKLIDKLKTQKSTFNER